MQEIRTPEGLAPQGLKRPALRRITFATPAPAPEGIFVISLCRTPRSL